VNAAVLLSGTDRQRPRVFVGFFDGKPGEGGRLFDIHRIPLLTPDVPYSVQAAFRSSIPGEHVLYAMILGEPGNRKSGETVSVPVTVSDTGSSGSGGCNAAGPGSAAALGFLIPLSLLGRRRR
jgi:uncharacterized protein (TIGR03382 family)